MKKTLTKVAIVFSLIFLVGLNSSCLDQDYDYQVYCSNAQVVISNNSDYGIYYSLDSDNPYCYSSNYVAPDDYVIISMGTVDTDSNNPVYLEFYYKVSSVGEAEKKLTVEITDCSNTIYLN